MVRDQHNSVSHGRQVARWYLAEVLTDWTRLLRQSRRWDEAENVYRHALAVRKEITSRAEKGLRQAQSAAAEARLQWELRQMSIERGGR
jgi:hypothetical protein